MLDVICCVVLMRILTIQHMRVLPSAHQHVKCSWGHHRFGALNIWHILHFTSDFTLMTLTECSHATPRVQTSASCWALKYLHIWKLISQTHPAAVWVCVKETNGVTRCNYNEFDVFRMDKNTMCQTCSNVANFLRPLKNWTLCNLLSYTSTELWKCNHLI